MIVNRKLDQRTVDPEGEDGLHAESANPTATRNPSVDRMIPLSYATPSTFPSLFSLAFFNYFCAEIRAASPFVSG